MSISVSSHIVQTDYGLNQITCRATVSVSEKSGSVNIQNNTSKVTVSYSVSITSNITFTGTGRPNAGYLYITVNGVENWFTVPLPSGSNQGTVLASGSYEKTITHSADGSKTIGYSCYIGRGTDQNNYNVIWETTGNASDTLKLTTIPRASTASASPNPLVLANQSNTLTVNTNRASSDFTHTVKVTVGSFSETKTGVGASTTFSIPGSLVSEITGVDMSGSIETTTYNGSTQIGSKTTSTFKVSVDTEHEHGVITNYVLEDTNEDTSPYTGGNGFINGASNLKMTLTLGVIGSDTTLARVIIDYNGKQQSTPIAAGSTTATVIYEKNKTTSSDMTVQVIDARGHSETYNIEIPLIPYAAIDIGQPILARVNASGQQSDTGEFLSFTIDVRCFAGSFGSQDNRIELRYKYKLKTDSEYTDGVGMWAYIAHGEGSVQTVQFTGITGRPGTASETPEFLSTAQYDVIFTAYDLFSTKSSQAVTVNEGFPVYYWGQEYFGVNGEFYLHSRDNVNRHMRYGVKDRSFSGTYSASGYVTSSGAAVVIDIPLTELPTNPTVANITSLTSALRTVSGGYIGGAEWASVTGDINAVSAIYEQSILTITIRKTSGTWGVTNNTPVVGRVSLTYTVQGG